MVLTKRVRGSDVFNIGSGNAMTVQAHGRDVKLLPVESRKRANDRPYLCPSVEKVTSHLGFASDGFTLQTAQAIWQEPLETRRFYE
jgi:hypothetical protein